MIKAKFKIQDKKKIFIKDGLRCVICGGKPTDAHHVYFGLQAVTTSNRNDINQGVSLCRSCHNKAHSCKVGEGVRQQCIEYLKSL